MQISNAPRLGQLGLSRQTLTKPPGGRAVRVAPTGAVPTVLSAQTAVRNPALTADGVQFDDSTVTYSPEVSPKTKSYSSELLTQSVKYEYRYAMLGLTLGLFTIIGGIVLGLHGVTGHTSWTAKVLGLESNISDAAPGVVLFVVGIFFVWITKLRVKLKNLKG